MKRSKIDAFEFAIVLCVTLLLMTTLVLVVRVVADVKSQIAQEK